jgi:hypothetical protein
MVCRRGERVEHEMEGIGRYWNMGWRRGVRVEHEMEGDREIVEYGMEERREGAT